MASGPSKILVSMLLPIGDTLFSTPALHALRTRYPRAHITVLAYPTNSGILSANPEVDRRWYWPTRGRPLGPAGLAQLFGDLRRERFDLVIQFSTYNGWMKFWTGAKQTSALRLPMLWWIRPGAGREWRKLHTVRHYAEIVERLGIPITDWRLRMEPTRADVEAVDRLLERHGIAPDARLLGIHPGGEGLWGRKKWPVDRFAKVADELYQRFGESAVVLGGKDDIPLAQELARKASSPVTVLAGQTTLGQTAALARRLEIFVGNDSSPLHIVAAMGTPVVGIYGLTDPVSYQPWLPGGQEGTDYTVVRAADGSGCCFPLIGGITIPAICRCLFSAALYRITPDQVVAAATTMLLKHRAGMAHIPQTSA